MSPYLMYVVIIPTCYILSNYYDIIMCDMLQRLSLIIWYVGCFYMKTTHPQRMY